MVDFEKSIWAAVFAANLLEENKAMELPNAVVLAIEEADNAIMALRAKVKDHDGVLHVDSNLEFEREIEGFERR